MDLALALEHAGGAKTLGLLPDCSRLPAHRLKRLWLLQDKFGQALFHPSNGSFKWRDVPVRISRYRIKHDAQTTESGIK